MVISVTFFVLVSIQINSIRAVYSFSIFLCMPPTRSGYKELGLEVVEPLQDQPEKSQWPPIGEEKRDDRVGDPFKIFLKESLE